MASQHISGKSIGRLIFDYLFAIVMAILGSILGQFIAIFLCLFIYGFATQGSGVNDMLSAFLFGELEAVGLSAGEYSASLASVVYTSRMYLGHLGIWIVIMIYLCINRHERPIIQTVTTKMKGNTPACLGLGLLFGLVLNGICALVAIQTGSINVSLVGLNIAGLIFLLVCVFIQSSAEELIFRCYLYQCTLRTLKSPWIAILLTAGLFSLAHLFNPGVTFITVANTFLVGILFGLLVWKFDSPWAAFGAHTGWNFMQAIVIGLPNSGYTTPFALFGITPGTNLVAGFAYDPTFGLEGSGMATILLILACALVWYLGKKKKIQPTNIWTLHTAKEN